MADYKHRATPNLKSKHKHNGSTALGFFGGFIAGAFIMGLVWLKFGPELTAGRVPGVSPPAPRASQAEPDNTPKPQFEFYTILPEMEVVIPDEEVTPPKEAKTKPAAATPAAPARPDTATQQAATDESYILQMGSFRKYADADRMKARLALIGIEAHVQKVSINNKETYHRVRSGPYHSQAALNRVRKLATDNNISTLVIRLKG
ncbi:MAG: SPOR domain-containing protein [Chromatiales bacterium]|jgi:cell division protein FtsN